jgi:hypothetical protein
VSPLGRQVTRGGGLARRGRGEFIIDTKCPFSKQRPHTEWPALATTSWVIVIFGEHQVMAQLIAKRMLIAPLMNKDFPVRPPLLARGNFTPVNLNHRLYLSMGHCLQTSFFESA